MKSESRVQYSVNTLYSVRTLKISHRIRVNFNMAELDPFEPDEDSDDENDQGGIAHHEEDEESDGEIPPEPIECRISIAKVK